MYKVLIADNDTLMCEALNIKISKNQNFEVINIVNTYEDTLKECSKNSVDILFLSSHISGINCIEASQFINQSFPETSIYVISSFQSKNLLKAKGNNAIQDIIEKPLNSVYLYNLLNSFTGKKQDLPSFNPFDELVKSLDNKSYTDFYLNTNQTSDKIYKYSKKDLFKVNELFKINVQNILLDQGFDMNIFDSIESQFPLTSNILQNSKSTEIWIFKVFDFIFKENSIKRYSILKNIFIYIDDHIHEEINLSSIVKSCNISQGYLSRIFREQFGISVTEYLHMKKIHLAKTYFYFNKDSIVDVAFKLGYNESSYFSKVFKKYENMTVKEYKNLCTDNTL